RFELRATQGFDEALDRVLRGEPPRLGEGALGTAGATRAPCQVADIQVAGAYENRLRGPLLGAGVRSVLAVPLLAEGRLLGGLVVTRSRVGEFEAATVELLRTFASQSALAIQNARLFREIEAKGRELEVANRHKSEFLASMSHELRTPLNAIIGYAELLQEEAEDLDQEGFLPDLERIHGAGKHLLGLINDILDLSKIEAGKMELFLETFEVAQLIADVRGVVQPLVEKNGNVLTAHCADDL